MGESVAFLLSVWVKFFFLFTPFFALSIFLSITRDYDDAHRRRLAIQASTAVGVLCFCLFFFGNTIFAFLEITLDSFRVGAGALLFLSAVALVHGGQASSEPPKEGDVVVVPLAMPVIVGPATIGTLLVLGAEIPDTGRKILGCVALVLAVASVGAVLWLASFIERGLGRKGIDILSKVTGVVLSALAAQMILTGVRHFLSPAS